MIKTLAEQEMLTIGGGMDAFTAGRFMAVAVGAGLALPNIGAWNCLKWMCGTAVMCLCREYMIRGSLDGVPRAMAGMMAAGSITAFVLSGEKLDNINTFWRKAVAEDAAEAAK